MSAELLSVDQVAQLLNLHVRTVRGYVRERRLKAVRIGKQYRIARQDLEALTGAPLPAPLHDTSPRVRHIDVSSIVQMDAVSPEEAMRLSNWLVAAAKGRPQGEPVQVQTVYDAERGRFKVLLTGGPRASAQLLGLLQMHQDA